MNFRQSNYLIRTVMPSVSGNAFKIIAAVADATWGWREPRCTISFRQFQETTGIKHRATIGKAIEEAIESGFIKQTAKKRSFCYTMTEQSFGAESEPKHGSESEPIEPPIGAESEPMDGAESEPPIGSENEPPSYYKKNQNKKNNTESGGDDALLDLVAVFEKESGITRPFRKNGQWDERWLGPLIELYTQTGQDFDYAAGLIAPAIAYMRQKELTIAAPKSILNVAIGIHARGAASASGNSDPRYDMVDKAIKELEESGYSF